MLRKILFSILCILMVSSAYLYRLIDKSINKTVSKSLTTMSKPLVKRRVPATKNIIKLPKKIKNKIIKIKTEKVSKNVSEKSEQLLAEVDQKIFYNREIQKIEKLAKLRSAKKIVTKAIKKRKPKKPQAYSKPLYKPKELVSENMNIDSSDRFVHTGYDIQIEIETIDLIALSEKVLLDISSTGTKLAQASAIVPEKLEETVESNDLFEVVINEEVSAKDELTYRFSANKKDFKIEKNEKIKKIEKPLAEKEEELIEITEIASSKTKDPINNEKYLVEEIKEVQSLEKFLKEPPVKEAQGDDLVFFDYSEKGDYSSAPIEPKKPKTKKSDYSQSESLFLTTQKAILNQADPKENQVWKFNKKKKGNRVAQNSSSQNVNSFLSAISDQTEKYQMNKNSKETEKPENEEAVLDVEALYVFSDDEETAESPFEIEFSDNGVRIDSGYEGFINIVHSLNGESAIRRAKVLSSDFIPSIVDFSIYKNEKRKVMVPVFSRKFWFDLIDREQVDEFKAALLIEKNKEFEVIPESINQKPILYNSDFEVVGNESEASYELYIDLLPGNITLSYNDGQNQGFKDIHLEGAAIYFEKVSAKLVNATIKLNEKEVLGSSVSPLDITENKLRQMYLNTKAIKRGVNAYQFKNILRPNGSRSYYQLYTEAKVDIGSSKKNSIIEIPSRGFKEEVLYKLDLAEPRDFCIIQINLPKTKQLDTLSTNGEGILSEGDDSKALHTEYHAFDSDGVFYTDIGEKTQKVFIIAEGTGVISTHLEYADETSDYLLSVCDSSYTVESLGL